MRASGTFKVVAFTPARPPAEPTADAAPPAGFATMMKHYAGEVEGRSATRFTAAADRSDVAGSYLAVESFEGSLGEASGAFDFAYSGTDRGDGRFGESFGIVPASGTGQLAGIRGTGGMAIDADGTHRIWFEYELD